MIPHLNYNLSVPIRYLQNNDGFKSDKMSIFPSQYILRKKIHKRNEYHHIDSNKFRYYTNNLMLISNQIHNNSR